MIKDYNRLIEKRDPFKSYIERVSFLSEGLWEEYYRIILLIVRSGA